MNLPDFAMGVIAGISGLLIADQIAKWLEGRINSPDRQGVIK